MFRSSGFDAEKDYIMDAYLDSELLILEVQKHPCLYDLKRSDYKNREIRLEAWMAVTKNVVGEEWNQMGEKSRRLVVKDIQKRWKNMRDAFLRNLRDGGKSDARKTKRPYIHHKHMDFLRGICGKRFFLQYYFNHQMSSRYRKNNTKDRHLRLSAVRKRNKGGNLAAWRKRQVKNNASALEGSIRTSNESSAIFGGRINSCITSGEEKEKEHLVFESIVQIKEEPVDYHPTPSTSTDTVKEEFILPYEENSWTPPVVAPPDPVVEPQFTLSVASLAPPNDPETSNGGQVTKKPKTKTSSFVMSPPDPVVEPQFTLTVAKVALPKALETSDDEQPKKKLRTYPSTITTLLPSANPPEVNSQSPVCNFGESSNPGSSQEPRKDQLDAFGEYIIAKLRGLDRRSSVFAQKAIVDIIFEAEMGKFLKEDCEYKVLKYCAS